MPLHKGDFIELEYTGKLKDEGIIFDTTDKKKAEEAGLTESIKEYGPVTVCIGENHVLKGIDEFLENKEIGSYTIELPPEKAFGKKSAKLVQMIPTSKFHQQKIRPMPGLQLNIDGMIATIKNVSAGRTLVDFNHPLSGKNIVYEVTIKKIETDPAKKVSILAKYNFKREADVEIKETIAHVKLKKMAEMPAEILQELEKGFEKKVISLVKEIRGVKIIL